MEKTERCVNAVLIAALLAYAGLFLYHAARLALYPYAIDYGEGFILHEAIELAHLRNPYQPAETPPWLVSNYPPVYPAAVAAGVAIFGVQFHFGRCLSIVGILVAGFCLFRMVRYQTEDRYCSWVAALFWIGCYPVYNWGSHHRVDSLGIGLEALGLLFVIRRNHLRLAIVFFLLALYTRQTLWMGPIAGYLYLRRIDGPRDAAKWIGTLLLSGGALFGLLTLLTGGEFFKHIVLLNVNKYHFKDVWVYFHNVVMSLMVVSFICMLYHILKSAATKRWDLAAYCMVLSVLTFLLSGKSGSATNYLFELGFASAWATGLVLAECRVLLQASSPFRALVPMFLAAMTLFPVHLPHLYGKWEILDWGGTPNRRSHRRTGLLVDNLRETPGPIFSQDSGVALMSGHDLVWQPFIMRQLVESGRVDPSEFHQMIRDKKFNAVVLPFDMEMDPEKWNTEAYWTQFSNELGRLIDENYRLVPANRPETWKLDRRYRGYFSPFQTNYLYRPR